MQLKFPVLALSLFVAVSGTSQVLANQNSNHKSCTSTSTSRASCTSTSSSQSILSSNEPSNSAASQNGQANLAGRSFDENDGLSSSSDNQLNPSNNSFSDRPATSSQEQSNPSLRLVLPSMQGIESDSNIEGLENEQSTPSSSERTNEAKPSGANDRLNPSNSNNSSTSDRASNSSSGIEQEIQEQINRYRAQKRLPALTLNESISEQARMHSQNMASGTVAFSHDGFQQRVKAISQTISSSSTAENVAYNKGYGDPATKAVEGWLDSPGHRQNIEGNYNLTGIGVAKNARGEYYFTQIFIRSSNNES